MNYAALKQTILDNADCQPYIVTNDLPKDTGYAVKDAAIAAILNEPTGTRIVERWENAIGLMSALGAISAATILEKLETAAASQPVIKWAMKAMDSDRGLNLGDAQTLQMLDALVDSVLTQGEVDSIKALVTETSSIAYTAVGQPVTAADVSVALRNY